MKHMLTVLAMAIGIFSGAAVADDTHGTSEKEEYQTSASMTPLLRSALETLPGNEVNIVQLEFPAGWSGGKHYHTGDVFLYVLEGELVIDMDGKEPETLGPGKAYHESVNKVMSAYNPSSSNGAKVIVIQVGAANEPLMIKAD